MAPTDDDEMIAAVDATLASWRSAFESSPGKERASTVEEVVKSPQTWKDREAYQRRLSTFKPITYFAKPIALSPLVCSTFG